MEYKKTKTRATMKGEWYEVKVAMLLFLRFKNSTRVSRFQLGTNVEGAGALDDIVFRFSTRDVVERWHTCFVQLKHKDRDRLRVTSFAGLAGDFSLKKYLKSYIDIKKMMNSDIKPNIFDGPFKFCNFVLYTNCKAEGKLAERKGHRNDIDMLLKSYSRNELVFMFDEENDQEIFTSLEEDNSVCPDGKSFLKKLIVFSGQPTESEIASIIKIELLKACGTAVSDADQIYRICENLFKEWWRDSNLILGEDSDILQRALNLLQSENELAKQTELLSLNINFDGNYLKSFNTDTFSNAAVIHLVANKRSIRLSATKILRLLQSIRKLFIFLSLEFLQSKQGDVMSEWQNGNKNYLVIVVETLSTLTEPQVMQEVCIEINNVISKNCDKCVVFISSNNRATINYLKKLFGERYKKIDDFLNLSQLDQKTKDKFLVKKMLFQGSEITFNEFFGENLPVAQNLLEDNIVEAFSGKYGITVGTQPNKVVHYYVSRSLTSANILKNDIILAGDLKDMFVVSGVTVKELNRLSVPVDVLRRAGDFKSSNNAHLVAGPGENDFNTAMLAHQDKNIHKLLKNNRGEFKWEQSHGNIDTIRRYIDGDKSTTYRPDTVLDLDARVVLVIAEPGMGKTTLLDNLTKETKNKHPALWVIRINMNDHTNILNNSPCDNALEFISAAVGINSKESVDATLLYLSFVYIGNVVVLLDGFDEIAPRYTEKGLSLLKSLLITKVRKVWVTSRHSMKNLLEQRLSTLSHHLEPFTERDQRSFFKKFWSSATNKSSMSGRELGRFITQVLQLLSDTLTDNSFMLPSIPLQAMIMAEVFKGHVMNPNVNSLPSKIDLFELFEMFLENKFQILIKDKMKLQLTNMEYLLPITRKRLNSDHMNASIVLLLSKEDIQRLHLHSKIISNTKTFMKSIETSNDKTGIVYGVINNQPQFLHRSFAEYFAAMWFSKYIDANREFIKDHIFTNNFRVIKTLFDRLLTKDHELHTEVLKNNVARVEELLSSGKADVNASDSGGRTPLHLAATLDFEFKEIDYHLHQNYRLYFNHFGPRPRHMVELLLDHGAKVDITDHVLLWTPLEYAFETEMFPVMEYFLARNVNTSNIEIPKAMFRNWDLLKFIILNGLVYVMKLFLDRGLPVNFESSDGSTLLHTSSMHGFLEISRLLISRNADKRSCDVNGDSCLHVASKFGHLSVMKLLIESDSTTRKTTWFRSLKRFNLFRKYINAQNLRGQSALYKAASAGNCVAVEFLIFFGADIEACEKDGRSCLHAASEHGFLNVAKAIIDGLAASGASVKNFISMQDTLGESVLHLISYGGHVNVATLLLSHGIDIWARDHWGRTALHWASEKNNLKICKAIIESIGNDRTAVGKFVNMKDTDRKSALYLASSTGSVDVVSYLISNCADIRVLDKEGRSCLHVASKEGHIQVAWVLVQSIGDDKMAVVDFINIRDSCGLTARDIPANTDETDDITKLKQEDTIAWLEQTINNTRTHKLSKCLVRANSQ